MKAADREVAGLPEAFQQQIADKDPEAIRTEAELRHRMKLTVRVETATGEWLAGTGPGIFSEEEFPESVRRVEFLSDFGLRGQQYQPKNSLYLSLDFRRVDVLDLTAQPSHPTPNESSITVPGTDSTWVNGVFGEIERFFRQRSTRREWLHARSSYDLLLLSVGFPVSFAWVHFLGKLAERSSLAPLFLFKLPCPCMLY